MSDEQHPPRHGEGDHAKHGGGVPAVVRQPFKQVRRARKLRKEMNSPEVLLWTKLRKRPGGHKFRKQVPFDPYTLDFACLRARLAMEVDGEAHDRGDRPQRDDRRDALVAGKGFQTLRVPAIEVLKNMEGCVLAIVAACDERGTPPPSLRDGPPPHSGENLRS